MECEAGLEDVELNFSKKFSTLLSECDTFPDGYALPLTPPLSPVTCYGSAAVVSTDCDCHRFQPICSPFGETLDGKQKIDSIVLKDCMWGYSDVRPTARVAAVPVALCQSSPAIFCNSVHGPSSMCCESNKLVGVDPTEVFPFALFDRLSNVEQPDFDDDSDIDVVTVDNDDGDQSEDLDSGVFLSPPKTPEPLPECSPSPTPVAQLSLIIPVTVSVARVQTPLPSVDGTEPAMATTTSSVSPRTRPSRSRSKCESSSDSDGRSSKTRGRRYTSLEQRLSRASHNVLERRRRNELKEKFYCLRDAIPGAKRSEKVPKVNILRNAIRFITQLEQDSYSHELEVARLKKANYELKQRLLRLVSQHVKKENDS